MSNKPKKRNRGPIVHGLKGYWRRCRCLECKVAYAAYQKGAHRLKAQQDTEEEIEEVIPIRPYQPKLRMEDFPKPDSYFEVLTALTRQPGKLRTWRAA